MKATEAREVLAKAKQLAEMTAELCRDGDGINNQKTLSVMMLATAIMSQFFGESSERMHALLEVMLVGTESLSEGNDVTIQ